MSWDFEADILRGLPVAGWQSLLNYLSSRIRAAAQSYISHYYGITEEGRVVYVKALKHEVVSCRLCVTLCIHLNTHPSSAVLFYWRLRRCCTLERLHPLQPCVEFLSMFSTTRAMP
jgi:hypothetical protein